MVGGTFVGAAAGAVTGVFVSAGAGEVAVMVDRAVGEAGTMDGAGVGAVELQATSKTKRASKTSERVSLICGTAG